MNAQSLQSVLVLLAQILGPFGQIWVFHKFGWVFHKFTENGEFYIVRILTIRHKNRDAWVIGLAVQRLNHSATLSSWSQLSPPCQSSLPGWAFSKLIECTRYGRFDTRYSSRCWKVRYLGIRQLSETISYSLVDDKVHVTQSCIANAESSDNVSIPEECEFLLSPSWTLILLNVKIYSQNLKKTTVTGPPALRVATMASLSVKRRWKGQTWNLSKILHRRIFRLKQLYTVNFT